MTDPLDPAAVEAAAEAIAKWIGGRSIDASRGPARAAITAYLDRAAQPDPERPRIVREAEHVAAADRIALKAELAEARASLEMFRDGMADMEASKDEAVARAEAAEAELQQWRQGVND